MRGIGLVLAATVLVGCADTHDSSSCTETRYSGGSLVDCGSYVTFRPRGEDVDTVKSPLLGSFEMPPYVMAFVGTMLAAQTPYTHCKETKVPEGTWIVCDGGFSQLERNDAAIAAYQRGLLRQASLR